MNFFKKIFRRKSIASSKNRVEEQLSIKGVPPAPITAEPDTAEIAAQALLEVMDNIQTTVKKDVGEEDKKKENPLTAKGPDGGASFYKSLAQKIRHSQEEARLRALRFVAFCEQELTKEDLPAYGPGSLGLLEKELLKRIDVVDRCGGELKKRWQYCLSEVIVKMVNHDEYETLKD